MKIKNIEGLSAIDLQQEVNLGGKFVYYSYTISLIVVTFKRTSGVYLVRAGENAMTKSLLFNLLSFLIGWWGIPYGPKYTLESIRSNWRDGKNVTDDVMATIAGYILFRETKKNSSAKLI